MHTVKGLEAADAGRSPARWKVPEFRTHVLDDARRTLEGIVSRVRASVDARVHVAAGSAARTILEHAGDIAADLIVVGRSRGFTLLGSTALRGHLRKNDRALLVIPELGASHTSGRTATRRVTEAATGGFGGMMVNRQLVTVAIDHATDVERTMAFALRTAKARGADVHAVQVMPLRAMHVDESAELSALEPRDDPRRHWGAGRIDADIGRTMMACVFAASRCAASPSASFRPTPSSTRPRYWWSTVSMGAPGSGAMVVWSTRWCADRRYRCWYCPSA